MAGRVPADQLTRVPADRQSNGQESIDGTTKGTRAPSHASGLPTGTVLSMLILGFEA